VNYEIKTVIRDGEPVRQLKCPKCGKWADLDDDQYYGRVSTFHDVSECGFHETIDFSKLAVPALTPGPEKEPRK
jgi:hypothetical protein